MTRGKIVGARFAIASVFVLMGTLTGCETPPPPSPEKAALEHQYEMGCRPIDNQGYERNSPYCGHGGRGTKF